jgi:hypothetical protein
MKVNFFVFLLFSLILLPIDKGVHAMIDPRILEESAQSEGFEAGQQSYIFENISFFKNTLTDEKYLKIQEYLKEVYFTGYTMQKAPDDGRVGHFHNSAVDNAITTWHGSYGEGYNNANDLDSDQKEEMTDKLIIKLMENSLITKEEADILKEKSLNYTYTDGISD